MFLKKAKKKSKKKLKKNNKKMQKKLQKMKKMNLLTKIIKKWKRVIKKK